MLKTQVYYYPEYNKYETLTVVWENDFDLMGLGAHRNFLHFYYCITGRLFFYCDCWKYNTG